MGKGDRKSRKGKIFRKSYGISRPRNKKSATAVTAKKAAPKKAAAKRKRRLSQAQASLSHRDVLFGSYPTFRTMQDLLAECIRSYSPVDSAVLEATTASFVPMELKKNEFFAEAGKACRRMAFIRSGLLRLYFDVDGTEVTQWIAVENTFVTDLASFLYQAPGRWSIQALTECELLVISHEAHIALSRRYPQWLAFENQLLSRCFVMLENRVFHHLHMSAEERFQQLFTEQRELFNRVPLQYLASMMGMTPETLSRLRKKALE